MLNLNMGWSLRGQKSNNNESILREVVMIWNNNRRKTMGQPRGKEERTCGGTSSHSGLTMEISFDNEIFFFI